MSAAEDAAALAAFADCEALIAAGLLALAKAEEAKADKAGAAGEEAYRAYQEFAAERTYRANLWQRWKDSEAARDSHDHRAACLREAALAVSVGQFRTDTHDPGLLAAAHRAAGVRPLAARAGRATSPAKAASSRANGRKGGRPKKAAETT